MVKHASWLRFPAGPGRRVWLSITPEPERELPAAVATLARGGVPAPDAVATEAARVRRLVLRGSQRRWLSYLHEVVGLTERAAAAQDPAVEAARARARAVICNHHNLLLALPGPGARLTAADRALLSTRTRGAP